MKASDIQIDKYNSIDEFYSLINNNALLFENKSDLYYAWRKYYNHTKTKKEKDPAYLEMMFFGFDLPNENEFAIVKSVDEKTNKITTFSVTERPEVYQYLIDRSKDVSTNHLLLAIYNHILWNSPKEIRNNKYANRAIFYYIESIYELVNVVKKKNKLYQSIVGDLYKRLVSLVITAGYYTNELVNLTNHLLFESQEIRFFLKHIILETMLKNKKVFKLWHFKNTLQIITEYINNPTETNTDFLIINNYIPTGLKIANKTNVDKTNLYNMLGELCEKLADESTEGNGLVKLDFYDKAIAAYKKSKNKNKENRCIKKYSVTKQLIDVPLTRRENSINDKTAYVNYISDINSRISELLTSNPQGIYNSLSNDDYMPSFKDLKQVFITNDLFEFKLRSVFTNKSIDLNNNISDVESFNEDFAYFKIELQLGFFKILYEVFINGIRKGALTFDSFIEYLRELSWLDTVSTKKRNLIELISPSIKELFNQLNDKNKEPNYVLVIDSLTLKIELLFRSFCSLYSIPTSTHRKKGMQEIYIEQILEIKEFKQHFNEGDLLLFNYVFKNSGLNLRNNVAHSFYGHSDYNIDKIYVLILVLLRLTNKK